MKLEFTIDSQLPLPQQLEYLTKVIGMLDYERRKVRKAIRKQEKITNQLDLEDSINDVTRTNTDNQV